MAADPYGSGSSVKTFTIRMSGAVRLYGPEIDIVDTPEFQRLDGLRQLGTAHLVFRSANHTRFEHSLGTLHEVQRIIDAVNRNPKPLRPVTGTPLRLARLAALLHDLVHISYGHTLEDEFHLLDRHDTNSTRRRRLLDNSAVGAILRSALAGRAVGKTNEYALLLNVLESNTDQLGDLTFVTDLVSNTVCADALDYVPRDLAGCGMPVGIGDRFLDYFVVTPPSTALADHANRMALRLDKRGMPRPDVESEVYKLLEHRYELVERVFFHHGKNAASAMVARAVQTLGLHENDANFDWLSDDMLRMVLARPGLAAPLGLTITDDPKRREQAAELGQAVMERRLYKLAYLGVADDDVQRRAKAIYEQFGNDPDLRRRAEDELAAMAGLPGGHVLLHVPSPRMLAKQGHVRVMLDNEDVILLSEWDRDRSGRLAALQRGHERLWRVSVYAQPDSEPSKLGLLTKAAEERFGLRTRYVLEATPSPYFGELFDLHAEANDWPAHLRNQAVRDAQHTLADARREGRNVSRSEPASVDLLHLAVRRLQRREAAGQLEEQGQTSLPMDSDE